MKTFKTIRWAIAIFVPICCCIVLGSACSSPARSSSVPLLRKSELTQAELKYGRGVQRDPSVIYQNDVVMVEHGPEVIRSAGDDGFSWTIDARAGRDLSVGKIAFVTGRCVGRILAMQREGENLRLILGPVELTEIFKKLEISVNQEIDPTEGIAYGPPALPGVTLPLSGDDATPPGWPNLSQNRTPRGAYGLDKTRRLLPAAFQLPPVFKLELQANKSLNPADGIGMEFGGVKYGLREKVQAQVRFQKPKLDFHLSINFGNVDARLVLQNGAGLALAFDSAVDEGAPRNVIMAMPIGSKSFPMGGTVPLAVDIRQDIYVGAEFMSGASSFSAGGNYDFNADFGMTFHNKTITPVLPKGLRVTPRKDLMEHITGVSIAPRSFTFQHHVLLTAGVGGLGFTAGPQLHLGTTLNVKQGGNTGIIQCQAVSLSMAMQAGVGWTIPEFLTKFVNTFLKLVRVAEIPDHGGVYSAWTPVFKPLQDHAAVGVRGNDTGSKICGFN